MRDAEAIIASLEAENSELRRQLKEARKWVIPALALYAGQWAERWELPKGHLHPTHYDALVRMGAAMDDFTRAEVG